MNLLDIRINRNKLRYYICYFFMFLIFLIPPAFNELYPGRLLDSIKIVSYSLLAINPIISKKIYNKSLNLIIAFNISLIVATIINKGNIRDGIIHASIIILICYNMTIILKDEIKREAFLYAIRDITLVFFVINIIVLFIYPNGITSITYDPLFPNFLYGNVNSTIKHIVAGMCCSTIIDAKKHKNVSLASLIFLFGIFYQAFKIYFTATSVIATIFLILWIYMIKKKKIKPKEVFLLLVFLIFIMEILFVFSPSFSELISRLFRKSTNLSNRTLLWENIKILILDKIFLGYGVLDDYTIVRLIGNFYGAHNYFLDIQFQRGLVGLSILIMIILYPIFSYKGKRNVVIDMLLGYSIFCQLIFLSEPIYNKEQFIIPIFFSLIYFINEENNNEIILNKRYSR